MAIVEHPPMPYACFYLNKCTGRVSPIQHDPAVANPCRAQIGSQASSSPGIGGRIAAAASLRGRRTIGAGRSAAAGPPSEKGNGTCANRRPSAPVPNDEARRQRPPLTAKRSPGLLFSRLSMRRSASSTSPAAFEPSSARWSGSFAPISTSAWSARSRTPGSRSSSARIRDGTALSSPMLPRASAASSRTEKGSLLSRACRSGPHRPGILPSPEGDRRPPADTHVFRIPKSPHEEFGRPLVGHALECQNGIPAHPGCRVLQNPGEAFQHASAVPEFRSADDVDPALRDCEGGIKRLRGIPRPAHSS